MCNHIQQEYDPDPCAYCAEETRRAGERRETTVALIHLVEAYLPTMNARDFVTYKALIEKLIGRPDASRGAHYLPHSVKWCTSLATGRCASCGAIVQA